MVQNNVDPAHGGALGDVFAHLGLSPGSVIDGKFRVERAIGMGGMSYVLEATHLMLEETVALKCLNPTWAGSELVADRFSREARSVVKIKNDHVAKVYDVGKLPTGLPYIVMELLRGEDLGSLLARRESVDLRTLAGWAIEACEGLAEAHALGIVHRDVKPENLFVIRRSDGRRGIKLLDFGISKQLLRGSELEQVSLSRTLELVGTPLYMSPEQVRLSRELDHRTDVWSLGAVFYEMLAGTPPFTGEGVTDLCARILEDPARPPSELAPGLPPELDRIVLCCLEKDAQRRYPSVAELASDLLPFAPPRYHAQVDRIIRTLHSVGLTRLQPSSVMPPALVDGRSMPAFPSLPTLPDFSAPSEAPSYERTASESGIVTRTNDDTPTEAPPRTRALGWAIGGVAAAALIALIAWFALSGGAEPTPELARNAEPSAAPAPSPTRVAPLPTQAVEPNPAVDPTTSSTGAPSAKPSRIPANPARPRVTSTPTAAPTPEPSKPAPTPKPGLDIELSR